MTVYFDNSLSLLADAIKQNLGEECLESGVVLRDANGALAFFIDEELPDEKLDAISTKALTEMNNPTGNKPIGLGSRILQSKERCCMNSFYYP